MRGQGENMAKLYYLEQRVRNNDHKNYIPCVKTNVLKMDFLCIPSNHLYCHWQPF